MAETEQRLPYVWDYDLNAQQFREILEGRLVIGRLDQDWAALRLLEYAPYLLAAVVIALIWRGKTAPKPQVG